MAVSWDAELYLRFADERTQPARDLVARIALENPRRIVDLGCGPGNSTELLRERWPQASILGIDNSPEMIAAARAKHPRESWELADAATWAAVPPCDLVFSNAALQWVPHHERLFPHLWAQVAAGGALAVQMPAHFDSPIHRLLLDVASTPRWRESTSPAATAIVVRDPTFYYELLQPLATRLELWETTYHHVLAGHAAILEWMRGTGLRPFLEALTDEGQRREFEGLVLRGVRGGYPVQSDGRVLFPFRRIFLVAYR